MQKYKKKSNSKGTVLTFFLHPPATFRLIRRLAVIC